MNKTHLVRYPICNNSRNVGANAEVEPPVSYFSAATGRHTLDNAVVTDIRLQENIGHTPKWVDAAIAHNNGWSSTTHTYLPTTAGVAVKTKETAHMPKTTNVWAVCTRVQLTHEAE